MAHTLAWFVAHSQLTKPPAHTSSAPRKQLAQAPSSGFGAYLVHASQAYGITPTQLALAWANQRDCNASIITGTCTLAQATSLPYRV